MEAAVRKPNFFIVGAPKCGTTSMYTYLKSHPEIFMPDRAELHFFGDDLDFRRRRGRMTLEDYRHHFLGAGDVLRVGEKSVWYLMSKNAPSEIYEFNPDAKIVVMLRNPVDVLHSLHGQLVYNGDEDIEDFELALAAERERTLGRRIPPNANLVQGLFYTQVVAFSDQILRCREIFGRDRIWVGIYDDLQRDAEGIYGDLLGFLEVPKGSAQGFPIVNPRKRARSTAVRDLVALPPPLLRRIGRAILPGGSLRYRFRRLVLAANTRYEKRPPMDPELRHRLQQEMRPEVERLSRLLGRDLMHWVEN